MVKMNRKSQKRKLIGNTGFTLIELLVVATIIIVLSAIGLVSYANAGRGARNAKRKSDLEAVRQAVVLYKSDNGTYPVLSPSSHARYETLVSNSYLGNGYISNPTPDDPKAGDADCGPSGGVVCDYLYVGTATTFTLTAPLEGDASYVLTQP